MLEIIRGGRVGTKKRAGAAMHAFALSRSRYFRKYPFESAGRMSVSVPA